jgi:N-acetylglucosaminyldiphosphoundecaprenol N-acetyl-beta-D-mannosaminyltransferase
MVAANQDENQAGTEQDRSRDRLAFGESTDILGVQINAINMPLAVETIESWIESREKHYVCICTVNSVMEANREPSYMEILNRAGMRTPDGMPLVWLSRKAGHRGVARVCGPDLMPELASRSSSTGHRHFFYGGAPGVAHELASRLSAKHPGLQIAGSYTPSMQLRGAIEPPEIVDRINDCRPDIVWIGLGTPKQDFWAANHREMLDAPVLIAVGAAFDFHSGRVKRAPHWMQRSGLEWLFRLSQDPRRLWRRYLLDNCSFVWSVLTNKKFVHQRLEVD